MRYGNNHSRYEFSIGERNSDGQAVLQLGSAEAGNNDSVWFSQMFSAENYRGRRIRLRLEMKADNLGEFAKAVFGILRGDGATLATSERQWLGTGDWREQAIVFDVPQFAAVIRVIFSLRGAGTVWLRNLKLEEVGAEVPADNTLEQLSAPAAVT